MRKSLIFALIFMLLVICYITFADVQEPRDDFKVILDKHYK